MRQMDASEQLRDSFDTGLGAAEVQRSAASATAGPGGGGGDVEAAPTSAMAGVDPTQGSLRRKWLTSDTSLHRLFSLDRVP